MGRISSVTLAGLCAAWICQAGQLRADQVNLTFMPNGAMSKIGTYAPVRLTFVKEKPKGLKRAPKGITAPMYSALQIGPREKPTTFIVILDEPEGRDARLFVDTNGNGDLTDDPPADWTKRAYQGTDGKQYSEYNGGATVRLKVGKDTLPLHLGMYRFDKRDPARSALKDKLLYYRDYAYDGMMSLAGKVYHVMVSDDAAVGDFRGAPGDSKASGISLLIDLDGDGKFKGRRETYDANKPFNIDGITYELSGLTAKGGSFDVDISSKSVAEIPDLRVGKLSAPFEAKAMDGREITFPGTYKGKIVLLDFWATWCGPCIAELPNLTRVYEKYHSRGFEVLGISLDQANAAEKVANFTRSKNMTWTHVYDGKFWDAAVAKLYLVEAIPQAYLVDGDTGEIIADSSTLRGEPLDTTIEKALGAKNL